MKTVLVTGAAGFVGRNFIRYFEAHGWRTTGLDIAWGVDSDAHQWFRDDRTAQYDLVVHAAAAGPNRKAIDSQPMNMPYNIELDAAMFNWVHRTAQPRVLYLSSCAVYPRQLTHKYVKPPFELQTNQRLHEDFVGYDFQGVEGVDPTPFDSYGWTKLIGEHMARALNEAGNTRVTVVRPFSGYGTDQSPDFPFRAFINRALRREDPFVIWGNGQQIRDWIHIEDVVRASLVLVEGGVIEPTNLCTGVGTSMNDLVQLIINELSRLSGRCYTPLTRYTGESNGADYRVGSTRRLLPHYDPKISLREGVQRALKEAFNG